MTATGATGSWRKRTKRKHHLRAEAAGRRRKLPPSPPSQRGEAGAAAGPSPSPSRRMLTTRTWRTRWRTRNQSPSLSLLPAAVVQDGLPQRLNRQNPRRPQPAVVGAGVVAGLLRHPARELQPLTRQPAGTRSRSSAYAAGPGVLLSRHERLS